MKEGRREMAHRRIGTVGVVGTFVLLLLAATAAAQSAPASGTRQGGVPAGGAVWTAGVPAQDFGVLAGPIDIGGQVVRDAPYTADAVMESARTLADGNRITRTSTSSIARDGRGRTRREQGLAVIGPFVAGGGQATQVVIADPDAGVSYVLDAENRRALRLRTPAGVTSVTRRGAPGARQGSGGEVIFFQAGAATSVAAGSGAPAVPFEIAVPPIASAEFGLLGSGEPQNARTDDLGTQTIEGVVAQGTRSTVTIPMGQIGNERAIEIVSERWYSSALKAVVLSRETNPMFGDTIYRLSNVVIGEPPSWMFDVPSDFEVVDGPFAAGGLTIQRRPRE